MSEYSITTLLADSDESLLAKMEKQPQYHVQITFILLRRSLDRVNSAVTSLNSQTKILVEETGKVHSAVDKLALSSTRMELITIIVGFVAFVQLVIGGVQTWKIFQPSAPVRVEVQYPAPTAPPIPSPQPPQ